MPRRVKTPAERVDEISELIVYGYTDEQISEALGIKLRTIRYHVERIRLRYGVTHKRELIPLLRADGFGA